MGGIIDEATTRGLGAAEPGTVRIFAAGCAERLAQAFCAVRAADPARGDDIAYVVETEILDRINS